MLFMLYLKKTQKQKKIFPKLFELKEIHSEYQKLIAVMERKHQKKLWKKEWNKGKSGSSYITLMRGIRFVIRS
jgi:hypothetical protein